MSSVVALILFFSGADLQGAQVIGLAQTVEQCRAGLAGVMKDTAPQVPKGVTAVPYCLDASPKIRPTSKQTQL